MKKAYLLCLVLFVIITGTTAYPFKKELPSTIFIDKALPALNIQSNPDSHTFQLFSHGQPGELLLQGEWRNAQGIAIFLKANLTASITHINIYGCEFAKGEKGLAAVFYLEKALHVSISASTNITGKDGDWVLETGKNTDVISLPEYNGNLQCSFGTLYNTQYATASSGGLTGPTYGVGAPDGSGVAVYTTATANDAVFTYANTFTAGADIIITAKYATASYPGGITVQFSTDNSAWTAASAVINGFTTSFTNVTYTIPGSLTSAYKYIKVHGNAANTYMPVDAIQVSTAYCNTCPSGITAPILSSNYIMLPCAASTVDLTTITASNSPANTTVTWHTGTPATNANKVATPSAASKATSIYYAAFYNAANDCYSGVSGDGTATTAVGVDQYSDCFATQCVNVNNAPWNKNTSVANNIVYNDGTQTRLANAASSNARIANATAVTYSTAVDTVATILPSASGVRPVTLPIGQAQTISAIYATPNATPANNSAEWMLGWAYSKTFTGAAGTGNHANTIVQWGTLWAAYIKVIYIGASSTVTLYTSDASSTIIYTGSILAGDSIYISVIPQSDGSAVVQGTVCRPSIKAVLSQLSITSGIYANEAAYPLYPSLSILLGATNVGCIKITTNAILAPNGGTQGTGISTPWQVNAASATNTLVNDGVQTRLAPKSNNTLRVANNTYDFNVASVYQISANLSAGDTSVVSTSFLAPNAGSGNQRWVQGWALSGTFSGASSPIIVATTIAETNKWVANLYVLGNVLYANYGATTNQSLYTGLLPGDQIIGKLVKNSGGGADLIAMIYRSSIGAVLYETYISNAVSSTLAAVPLYAAVAVVIGEANLSSIGGGVAGFSILPVKLISFTGALQNGNAQLQWQTAAEENMKYYEVFRSVDGISFISIGKVNAYNNYAVTNQYRHTDFDISSLTSKNIYYRIVAVNLDGSKDQSKTILIKQAGAENKISVYPNPSSGAVWFNSLQDVAAIKVYAYDGSLVKQYANIDASKLQYDLSALSNGSYAIRLIKKSGESTVLNVMLVK